MYCRKCGTQLPENARFCGRCGARATDPDTPGQRNYAGFQAPPAAEPAAGWNRHLLETWGMTVTAALALILIFCKWISVPVLSLFTQGQIRFSPFQAADLGSMLAQIGVTGGGVPLALVFILTGLVLALVLCVMALIGGWRRQNRAVAAGLTGSALGFVLTAVVMAAVGLIQWKLNHGAGRMMQGSVSLTAAPWVLLAVFAANLFFTIRYLAKEKTAQWIPVVFISALVVLGIMVVVTLAFFVIDLFVGYRNTPQNQIPFPGGVFDEWNAGPEGSSPTQFWHFKH